MSLPSQGLHAQGARQSITLQVGDSVISGSHAGRRVPSTHRVAPWDPQLENQYQNVCSLSHSFLVIDCSTGHLICPSVYSFTQPTFIKHHCLPCKMLDCLESCDEQNRHNTYYGGPSSLLGNTFVNKLREIKSVILLSHTILPVTGASKNILDMQEYR